MNPHRDDPHGKNRGSDDFTALLSAYLDGELAPPEAADVEHRIAADPQAARLLADLRLLRDTSRALPERAPQHDLWPAIAQRLSTRAEAAAVASGAHAADPGTPTHRTATAVVS
jgi:anti-sigma factor RsiW